MRENGVSPIAFYGTEEPQKSKAEISAAANSSTDMRKYLQIFAKRGFVLQMFAERLRGREKLLRTAELRLYKAKMTDYHVESRGKTGEFVEKLL